MTNEKYSGYNTTSNELFERQHRNSPAFHSKKVFDENAKIAMEFSRILEERVVSMRNRIYEVLENFSGGKDKLYMSKFAEKLAIIAKVANEEYCEKVRVFLRCYTESEKEKLVEIIGELEPDNMEKIVASFFAPELKP